MSGTANRGVVSPFAIGSAHPIVAGQTTGQLLNILTDSVAAVRGVIDGNAMLGTRSHYANRSREGLITVGGAFSGHPTFKELSIILPKVLGGNPSGTSYPLADALPNFCIQKKLLPDLNTINSYPDVMANVGTFTATRGQPIGYDVSVLGLTVVAADTITFDAGLTPDTASDTPVFHDLSLSVAGQTYQIFEFSLTVNNALDLEMINARNATEVFPTDRVITISHPLPQAALLASILIDTPAAVVATFTYNNQSLIFTLPSVRYTIPDAVIASRGEIRQPINGMAFRTSGSLELVTTLDFTP